VSAIKDLQKVINGGLCNRCGACVGLSGGKIVFGNKEERYLPQIKETPDEETLNTILQACSGRAFDFPANRKHIFGEDTPSHIHIPALTVKSASDFAPIRPSA
jgi:hypothetical protein